MEHSKLPWRVATVNDEAHEFWEGYDILADIGNFPKTGIATVVDERFSNYRNQTVALHKDVCKANADFICLAVNFHDRLVDFITNLQAIAQVDALIGEKVRTLLDELKELEG